VTVLDTQAWLWWLHDPTRLSEPARACVAEAVAAGTARVSAISVWEVATKAALGKLELPLDIDAWFAQAARYPGIAIDAVGPVDAIASTRLPGAFHRDPADRLIVALARRHGAAVVTSDAKIRDYPHVRTVW
jgi:PIN domain nuclease of toxin-antitoxin system